MFYLPQPGTGEKEYIMGLETAAIIAISSAAARLAATAYGAHKTSSTSSDIARQQIAASERAAKLEKEAADKQLAFLKEQDEMDRAQAEITRRQAYDTGEASRQMTYEQWADRQRKLAPYQGMGQASAGTLSNLMGFKPGQMTVSEPTEAVPYQNIPYVPANTKSPIPGSLDGPTTPTTPPTVPTPSGGTLGALAGPAVPADVPGVTPPVTGMTPPVSAIPTSGGMVWMRAPDGTTKQVPAFAVPHYQRLGAMVINASLGQIGAVA
jgi:hypothetical protein